MTITKATFVASCLSPELARAVINQCSGWSDFLEIAPDVARHGADAGFAGWTYHSDTVPFGRDNRRAILALAKEQAAELGMDVLEFVGCFACLRGRVDSAAILSVLMGDDCEDADTIYNALAWYAIEEVSRAYVDATES